MVGFLLKRPIAVIMAFLAVVILGCVTFVTLPVSLLPDVAIPHISVQVTVENMSARELEAAVIGPLRRQLMQVSGLSEIKSETRDASSVIRLTMDYGIDTDLAFIEVNEKIDAAMNTLPRDISRPKAIKASATDIPVFYINLTLRNTADSFLEMGDVADEIVRRRLEQLPEVAMVDISGIPSKVLRLTPDRDLMQSAGIAQSDIESALSSNNVEPGSLTVRDGYYEYSIHISNQLRTPQDVKDVKLMKNGRVYTIGDFCKVELVEKDATGYSTYNGKRAVTLAIIKHDAESMGAMEKAIDRALDNLSAQYPGIEFSKSRSQTQLLDATISNLEQDLLVGLLLVFLVCALFMRSLRLPFVIGITIIVAVIITFLLFYLFKVSINVISLAGLILAVGMMIDNSVIVAENITQFRQRGLPIFESCVKGTNEMITPMLSSSLTTVAVFVPLVFMSGIAGAIFADQAFSITAGLASSYIVGISLMPLLYFLFFRKRDGKPVNLPDETGGPMIRWYDRGIDFVFSHKKTTLVITALIIIAAWPLYRLVEMSRMPSIDASDTMITVDWNENINIDENLSRSDALARAPGTLTKEHSAYVGVQDFMLGDGRELSGAESQLYLRAGSPDSLQLLKDALLQFLSSRYPKATFEFNAPDNVFERVFSSTEPPLEARFSVKAGSTENTVDLITDTRSRLTVSTGEHIQEIPMRDQINIHVDPGKLAFYNVDYATVLNALRTAFKGSKAVTLRSYQEFIPVEIGIDRQTITDVIANTLVAARPGKDGYVPEVPLSALVSLSRSHDFKTILADEGGEYIPMAFDVAASRADEIISTVTDIANSHNQLDVAISGSLFSNSRMMREFMVILIVSLLMMYFILCAQFESILQPFIVLIEIPIDITFALLCLWIYGQTLNLMSAIGIIVTCGIVINDSILKIDAVNELRKAGVPLLEAIHTAGHRRLKPIIMTSLTTILAMVPVLFTSDLGSQLQRPLTIAMAGSMIFGTIVSIFLIPLVYYLIYRKHHVSQTA